MKLTTRTHSSTASRSGIVLLLALFVPVFVAPLFYWSVYVSPDAHATVMGIAVAVSLPGTIWLVRRRNRIVADGIDPIFPIGTRLPLKTIFFYWAMSLFGFYSWALGIWTASLALPNAQPTLRKFSVTGLEQCHRRCGFCSFRVDIGEPLGLERAAKICTPYATWSQLRIGGQFVVEGRMDANVTYISSVRPG